MPFDADYGATSASAHAAAPNKTTRDKKEGPGSCSLLCLFAFCVVLVAGVLTVPDAPFTGERPNRKVNEVFAEQAGREMGEVSASEGGAESGSLVHQLVDYGVRSTTKFILSNLALVNHPNFRSWNLGCCRVVHFDMEEDGSFCFLGACKRWTLCSRQSVVAKARNASAAAKRKAQALEDR